MFEIAGGILIAVFVLAAMNEISFGYWLKRISLGACNAIALGFALALYSVSWLAMMLAWIIRAMYETAKEVAVLCVNPIYYIVIASGAVFGAVIVLACTQALVNYYIM